MSFACDRARSPRSRAPRTRRARVTIIGCWFAPSLISYGHALLRGLDLGRVVAAADQPLDREDRVLRIDDLALLGRRRRPRRRRSGGTTPPTDGSCSPPSSASTLHLPVVVRMRDDRVRRARDRCLRSDRSRARSQAYRRSSSVARIRSYQRSRLRAKRPHPAVRGPHELVDHVLAVFVAARDSRCPRPRRRRGSSRRTPPSRTARGSRRAPSAAAAST